MRLLLLPLLYFCTSIPSFSLHPIFDDSTGNSSDVNLANEKNKIKLTLVNLTYFSLPTIKVSGEHVLKSKWDLPVSIGADLGYNFYSVDERVKAKGFFAGGRMAFYVVSKPKQALAASFSFFGSRTYLNDYLQTTRTAPGFGDYAYYEKFKYTKDRFGYGWETIWQFRLQKKLFGEIAFGAGMVTFITNVPGNVTQLTYINGLSRQRVYNGPTALLSFKVGYCL